jgi:DNA-binding NtrC family response regulator
MKILLVEDDKRVAKALAATLKERQYVVDLGIVAVFAPYTKFLVKISKPTRYPYLCDLNYVSEGNRENLI